MLQVLFAACSIQLIEKQGSFSSWGIMLTSILLYWTYVHLEIDKRILNPGADLQIQNALRFFAPLFTLAVCWAVVKENWELSKVNSIVQWFDFAHLYMAVALIKGMVILNLIETLYSSSILSRMSTRSKIVTSALTLLGLFASLSQQASQMIIMIVVCTALLFIFTSISQARHFFKAS